MTGDRAVGRVCPVSTDESSRSIDAYRAAFRAHTPAAWDLVVTSQADLLKLLVGRVAADVGVGVVFGLAVLFGEHPKGDDAGRALLATALADLSPARANMLLATLADAWHTAERRAFDERPAAIRAELLRALRRLLAADLGAGERGAVEFLAELVSIDGPRDSR